MKQKEILSIIGKVLLLIIAFMVGATSGVSMAEAVVLPGGGTIATHGTGTDGILTIKAGSEASPDLYLSDVDKRITKIRPNFVPVDTIARYAKQVTSESMEYRYYSTSSKPILTTLKTVIAKQENGSLVALESNTKSIFDLDDTIRVVGVKGFEKGDINIRSKEDLVLCVGGVTDTQIPMVFAVNGLDDGEKQYTYLPEIPAGTTLIRMGKACSELSAQTSKFANIPTPETMYCQNFMTQVEESTFDELTKKEVNFDFSDMEEENIYDMRIGQELSFMFGKGAVIGHPAKRGEKTWFTGGIWFQAGKDIELGTYDANNSATVITDDELVDLSRLIFTGLGSGNSKKIMLCGSEFLSSLSKIKSDKFRLKDSVDHWSLRFKSFDTDFGEMLAIPYQIFDDCKMSDCAMSLDPEFLTKVSFLTLKQTALNLKESGQRNSKATVLQEASGLYLRNVNAHARIRLKKA